MVLRKPYAFLIKHFKAVHIVLTVLLVYISFRTTDIYNFFSDYADLGRYTYVNNLAAEYIDFFMYGAILLILGLFVTILLLMRSKDKPTKFYIGSIIYYIVLFIMLTVVYSVLHSLQTNSLDTQVARIYRDLILMVYVPQYFFIIYSGLRAVGFNIKKFNFQKDLDDLEAEEKDREEVEIVAPKDTYKIERKIRRFIREFIYYYKENTLVVSIIFGIVVMVLGTLIFFNTEIYNKEYKVNQTFTYKTFNITGLESTLTNFDYNGNILIEGKYYLAIKMKVTNKQKAAILDMKHFRLLIDEKAYYPTFTKNEYFIDLGLPYAGENFLRDTTKEIILIYEIDQKNIKKEYRLRVVDKIDFKLGTITPSYKDLKIKPTIINSITNKGNYIVNNEINFKDSEISESTLKINNYQITNNYRYEYDYCYKDNCTKSYASIMAENIGTITKTLLVLDYDLNLADSDYKSNIYANRYFFTNFIKVRYTVEDRVKQVILQDKTPASFENKYIAQVSADISNATSIDLIITVRNYEYIVKLK